MRLAGFLLVPGIFSLLAQGMAPDAAASDKERLQGKWTVVAYYRDGESVEEPPFDSVTFAADKAMLTIKTNLAGERTFKLDETTEPKQIDLMREGKAYPGIYAIEGDTLLWCLGGSNGERPTTFAAEIGDGRTFVRLKGETRGPGPAAPTPGSDDVPPVNPGSANIAASNDGTAGGAPPGNQPAGSVSLGRATLFVLGAIVGFWFWRRIWYAINNRTINVVKYLTTTDFGISDSELRGRTARQATENWINRIRTSSRAMFWKSSIIPALALIVGLALVRFVDHYYRTGIVSFVVFLVIAGLLQTFGFLVHTAFLTMRIQDGNTHPAAKLVCLLERPRSSLIYRIEMLLLIGSGAALCFVDPARLLDGISAG